MKSYFEIVFEKIIDGVNLPRMQVERQISPFLDNFIEQIVSAHKNKEYKLIGAEFPIQSEGNDGTTLESSSVDYLFYAEESKSILLVALKTDSDSFDTDQYNNYLTVLEKIKNQSAIVLYNFLSKLKHKKFIFLKDSVIDKKFDKDLWKTINNCELLYIAPERIKERNWGAVNRDIIDNQIDFLHFKNITDTVDTNYFEEWKIIRNGLAKLNNN